MVRVCQREISRIAAAQRNAGSVLSTVSWHLKCFKVQQSDHIINPERGAQPEPDLSFHIGSPCLFDGRGEKPGLQLKQN